MTDNLTPVDAAGAPDDNGTPDDAGSDLSHESFDYMCTVCGTELNDAVVECDICRKRFHRECWEYCGVCPAIGCGSLAFSTVLSAEYAGNLSPETKELIISDEGLISDDPVDAEVVFIGSSQEKKHSPAVSDDPDVVVLDGALAMLIKLFSLPGNMFTGTTGYLITQDEKYMENGFLIGMLSGDALYTTARALMFAFVAPLFLYLAGCNMISTAVTVLFSYLIGVQLAKPLLKRLEAEDGKSSLTDGTQLKRLSASSRDAQTSQKSKSNNDILFIGSDDSSGVSSGNSEKSSRHRSERLKKHRRTRQ
jgi:hypothetical protein